jgi:hypothetical protein
LHTTSSSALTCPPRERVESLLDAPPPAPPCPPRATSGEPAADADEV